MSPSTVGRIARRARREVRQRVEPPAAASWRRRVLAAATDVTDASAGRSCLVFAPHPDDETIGCGATIARKRAAGTRVRVVVATDGRLSHRSDVLSPDRLAQVRAEEVTEACSRLGVEPGELILLGHREGTLSDDPAVITGQLTEQIDDFGPDEVLVTSARDWHLDHQILNRAASDAVAALGRPTSLRLREYPVWLWADGPWRAPRTGPAVARAFKPITEPRSIAAEHVSTAGFVDIKREALMCHRSQTTNITGEPGWPVLDRSFLDKFLGPVEIFLAPSTLI